MKLSVNKKKQPKRKQTKPESGGVSTLMSKDSGASHLSMAKEVIHSKAAYHQSCETLRYLDFVKILSDGNLVRLVISGKAEPDALQIVWKSILQEYSGLIKTVKSQSIFIAVKKINELETRKAFAHTLIGLLRYKYSKVFADALVEMGFEFISEDRGRGNAKQLDVLELEVAALIVFINQAYAEYKLVCPDIETEGSKKDYSDYLEEIAVLSRFQGYKIIDESVLEVSAIINSFNKKNKQHGSSAGDQV